MTKRPCNQVGLLYHETLADSAQLAGEIARILGGFGATVWAGCCDDQGRIMAEVGKLDMIITLGGDGTILRTARLAAPYRIPVLGVNLGRLGFLAEMQPSEVLAKLPQLRDGEFWLEERLMLHAEHRRNAHVVGSYEALNDVFAGRGRAARVVRIAVTVDGARVGTYVADGVVVATPTGSTAYNLSAGGPIVAPDTDDLLLTPIAPHLTPARSIVLPSESTIKISIATQHDGMLTVDGWVDVDVKNEDELVITKSAYTAQFVRLGPRNYFYETLIQRLNRRTDNLSSS
ncbi:MAG: NAD(+)/NADH kinase [Chloroflexi bacterium]|nr:NAD(+)/NADH kinase [Chloroflexota bacterium]